MSAGDFFSRWSRRSAQGEPEAVPTDAQGPAQLAEPAPELPPPTLDDVAALGHDADFRRFVKPGVDETVRRSAMKKLFTDPHFNVMDGLDIYIGDYNTFEPIPPAMLAMLTHAKQLLDPLGHLQQPAMRMLDRIEQLAPAAPADAAAASVDDAARVDAEAGAPTLADSHAGDDPAIDARPADTPIDTPTDTDTPADDAVATSRDPATPEDDHTI